jgi:hypothetical protein
MKRAHITGEIYTHRLLWHVAACLKAQGDNAEEGATNQFLGSLAFVYFALEAFLNDLGARVAPDEWANERETFGHGEYRGTIGKLDFLSERLAVVVDRGRRPYQTVVELEVRRDAMVHGRTEVVDHVIKYRDASRVPARKDPDLFQLVVGGFLDRAIADVEELCDRLQAAAQTLHGEHEIGSPRAFIGMMWHQGGTLGI